MRNHKTSKYRKKSLILWKFKIKSESNSLSKNSKSDLKGDFRMKKVLFLSLILAYGISIYAQNEPAKIVGPVSGGVLNGKAISLVKPVYPAAAKAVRASGTVSVQVLIDEEGTVVTANAVSGHPLLRAASEQAARSSKFSPTTLSGQPVKVSGIIVYNFVGDFTDWLKLGQKLGGKDLAGLKNSDAFSIKFTEERKQLDSIIAENQPEKLDDFVETLQAKIYEDKSASWELSVGIAIGRIKANLNNQNEVRTQLLKIKELSDFLVGKISEERLSKLRELGEFISKSKFDKKDKVRINELCDSIQ
jgi:TonB family protein